MAGLSDYSELELLKWITGQNGAMGTGLTRYLALGTAATDAGFTEVPNSNNYSRVNAAGVFDAPAAGSVDNASLIAFPVPSAGWGTITHLAIVDSATHGAGNCLAIIPLASPIAISSANMIPEFAAGAVVITAD